MGEFRSKVLETLSFFESMSFEKIILDFDADYMKNHPDFTRDKLEAILKELVKEKLVIELEENGEKAWKRVFKKKTLLQKIKDFFAI